MQPLEGTTVIEFSTMITASFAAMMMAEQGAIGLKRHAEEEMKYLAALLPPLYGSQDID